MEVNMHSYIPNEEWDILSFTFHRHEYHYACCSEPWAIIEGLLIIRRKPLYYVFNLIIPTVIITLVAMIGFFTPASTSDERAEKITLGMTSLLAMSILMMTIFDQMPTTSDFVPLLAWFYLSIIIVTSVGTFCTSAILYVHGHHKYGKLPPNTMRKLFFIHISNYLCLSPPYELVKLWNDVEVNPFDHNKISVISDGAEPLQKAVEDSADDELYMRSAISWTKHTRTRIPLRLKSVAKQSDGLLRRKIRKLPTSFSNGNHLWNFVAEFVQCANYKTPEDYESTEVKSMIYNRQCTLEWEFLAEILERIFLIFFIGVTMLIIVSVYAVKISSQ